MRLSDGRNYYTVRDFKIARWHDDDYDIADSAVDLYKLPLVEENPYQVPIRTDISFESGFGFKIPPDQADSFSHLFSSIPFRFRLEFRDMEGQIASHYPEEPERYIGMVFAINNEAGEQVTLAKIIGFEDNGSIILEQVEDDAS